MSPLVEVHLFVSDVFCMFGHVEQLCIRVIYAGMVHLPLFSDSCDVCISVVEHHLSHRSSDSPLPLFSSLSDWSSSSPHGYSLCVVYDRGVGSVDGVKLIINGACSEFLSCSM